MPHRYQRLLRWKLLRYLPPSTMIHWPVIFLALSLARKLTVAAISSGVYGGIRISNTKSVKTNLGPFHCRTTLHRTVKRGFFGYAFALLHARTYFSPHLYESLAGFCNRNKDAYVCIHGSGTVCYYCQIFDLGLRKTKYH